MYAYICTRNTVHYDFTWNTGIWLPNLGACLINRCCRFFVKVYALDSSSPWKAVNICVAIAVAIAVLTFLYLWPHLFMCIILCAVLYSHAFTFGHFIWDRYSWYIYTHMNYSAALSTGRTIGVVCYRWFHSKKLWLCLCYVYFHLFPFPAILL